MPFKEYEDPEELRHVQTVAVRILNEFDRVCRALDIPYVVYGGTAIGAVRHHGFIPWDDDVDVALSRAAYERFLREAPELLSSEFAIANARTMAEFPSTYSQLTLKGTLFIPDFYKAATYRPPLSLDVFPLDNVADDPRAARRQCRATWVWGRLKFLRATATPYLALTGWKRFLVLAACAIAHGSMCVLHVSPRWIQQQWEGAARRYEGEETRLVADFSDRSPMDWATSEEEMFPAIDVPFEDITVRLPRHYDAILTRGYGDYMRLPPMEERKNHHPFLVDLGSY